MRRVAGLLGFLSFLFVGINPWLAGGQEPTLHEFKLRAKRTEHDSTAFCVAFSPDGKLLASGSKDRTIKLWDVATAKVTATLAGHSGGISAVTFSPDGKTLLVGSGYLDRDKMKYLSGDLTLWDVASRVRQDTLAAHPELVRGVDYSPDGKLVATTGQDHSVRLWDVEGKGLKLRRVVYQGQTFRPGPRGLVRGDTANAVAFSPDGTLLAGGGENFTVVLWGVASGREKARMEGHAGGIRALAFSPDGKTLASTAADYSKGGSDIRLWDVAAGKESRTLIRGREDSYHSLAFSRDGRYLVSGSNLGLVKLWDMATGKDTTILNEKYVAVYGLQFSPNGKILAAARTDGTLVLWDVLPAGKDK